jgi:hypothetical protein
MRPVLQGSALQRTPDPAATKFPFDGAPDAARETLSVLLDSGNAASILDEPGFAGVCPMADPAVTKIRVIEGAKPRQSIRVSAPGSCAWD